MANVFVVEDDPTFMEYLRLTLETIGYKVRTAGDAMQALDMVRQSKMRVDLWVIDWRMPRMNGFQLTRALRGIPYASNAPIILFSAFVTDLLELDDPGVFFLSKSACKGQDFLDLARKLTACSAP